MKIKIFIVLIAMMAFNGVANLRELNDLAIVSVLGIEKAPNNEYKVTAQILNTKKEGESSGGGGSGDSGGSNKIVSFESSASTVHQALREMISEVPKRLYLSHMDILILSEDIAKEDILDTLNFFIRDNESSEDFNLLISKNCSPSDVLKVSTEIESNPSTTIKDCIESSVQYMGNVTKNILSDNLAVLLNKNKNLVVTTIELKDKEAESNLDTNDSSSDNSSKLMLQNKKSTSSGTGSETSSSGSTGENSNSEENNITISVNSLAYTKDRKFAGYLEEDESIIYNILQNKVKNSLFSIGKGEDRVLSEINEINSKMKPKFEDNKCTVDIEIKQECTITEIGKNIKLVTNEDVQNLQKNISEELKNKMESFIVKCQTEYNADIIGFGDLYNKYLNKEYKHIEDKFYSDYFSKIQVNVKVDTKIYKVGGVYQKW